MGSFVFLVGEQPGKYADERNQEEHSPGHPHDQSAQLLIVQPAEPPHGLLIEFRLGRVERFLAECQQRANEHAFQERREQIWQRHSRA